MKVGIVLPRYLAHTPITAGAERLGGEIAHRLAARGHAVEIITTCTLDLEAPRNVSAPGLVQDGAVAVRRFEIDLCRFDPARYHAARLRWMHGSAGSPSDEEEWFDAQAHAPGLYDHLDRCHANYDALLFIPYLVATTLYGAPLCGAPGTSRAAVMPALHDEPFARMPAARAMLARAGSVLFMTEPERDLAVRRLGLSLRRANVVGAGVSDIAPKLTAAEFRHRYRLNGPVVLYKGRIEPSKNVPVLIAYFEQFRREYPRHADTLLVLQGTPGLYVAPRTHVRVLPPDPWGDRSAYAVADVLCQPSQFEAFSVVLMEGWLAGVPALVHAGCEVTRAHARACNGGLWFGDAAEFGAALEWLLAHPAERAAMGVAGRHYVLQNYTWSVVLSRIETALSDLA